MYTVSLRFTEFKNLLLNFCMISLCHLCLDLKKESSFNIDLIVSAIRTSSNPQTHHKALLVLSTASKIFPVLFFFSVLFTLYLRFFTYSSFQYDQHVWGLYLLTPVILMFDWLPSGGSPTQSHVCVHLYGSQCDAPWWPVQFPCHQSYSGDCGSCLSYSKTVCWLIMERWQVITQ